MDADRSEVEPLPPYPSCPGGPWPHPTGSPQGHSAGRAPEPVAPIEAERLGRVRRRICRGVALFNAGYYWEAHEAWEGLWHAHGRRGPTADVLKGLIKLAAAGVKVRERQRARRRHPRPRAAAAASRRPATRGAAISSGSTSTTGSRSPSDRRRARPTIPGRPDAPVSRVFAFRIEPRSTSREAERCTSSIAELDP